MPEKQNADVDPKPAGEKTNRLEGDEETAGVTVEPPNEPGLDRDAKRETAEPAIKPADEVSEGR